MPHSQLRANNFAKDLLTENKIIRKLKDKIIQGMIMNTTQHTIVLIYTLCMVALSKHLDMSQSQQVSQHRP